MPIPDHLLLNAELRERIAARREILRTLTALREELGVRIDELTEAVDRLGWQARALESATMDSRGAADAQAADAEAIDLLLPPIPTEPPSRARQRLSAIGAEVAAMPRPITTDEINALLDRAAQPTASLAPAISRSPSDDLPGVLRGLEARQSNLAHRMRELSAAQRSGSQSAGAFEVPPRRQPQRADSSDDRITLVARESDSARSEETLDVPTPLFTSALSDRWRVVRGGNLPGRPSPRQNQEPSAGAESPAPPAPRQLPALPNPPVTPLPATPVVVEKKEIGRMAEARAKGCRPTNLRLTASMPPPRIVRSSRPRPTISVAEPAPVQTQPISSPSRPSTGTTEGRSPSTVSSPLSESTQASAPFSLDQPGFDIYEFLHPDVQRVYRAYQNPNSNLTYRGMRVADSIENSNAQASDNLSTARRDSTPMARAVGTSSSLTGNTLEGWPLSRQYVRNLGENEDSVHGDAQPDVRRELRRAEAGSMRALARNIVDAQREIAEQQAQPPVLRPAPVPTMVSPPVDLLDPVSMHGLDPGRSAAMMWHRRRLREIRERNGVPFEGTIRPPVEFAPSRETDDPGEYRSFRDIRRYPVAQVDDPIRFDSWDTDGPAPTSPTVRSQRPLNVQIEENRAYQLENDGAETDRLYSRIAAGRPLPLAVRRAFTQLREEGDWTGDLEDVGSRVARATTIRPPNDIPNGIGGDIEEAQENRRDSDPTVELLNVVIETVVRTEEETAENAGVLEGSGEREASDEPDRRRVTITVPAPTDVRRERSMAPSVVGIRDDDVESMNSSQILERLMSQYASEPILGQGAQVGQERQRTSAERGVQATVGAERRAEQTRDEHTLPESRGTRAAALVETKDPAEVPAAAVQPTSTRRSRPYISMLDL